MKQRFTVQYILLVLVQLLLCNYFRFTPYVMLSILPVLVLCIPTRVGTVAGLFIAFFTGLSVDFLAEGVVGINTFALVPVALLRRGLIRLVFDEKIRPAEGAFRDFPGPDRISAAVHLG